MRAERKTYQPVWDIDRIEQYFTTRELPETPVVLNSSTVIVDIRKMIDSHIGVIRANNGNPIYKRFYIRLKQLKKELENGNSSTKGDFEVDRDERKTDRPFQNRLL